ncbi:zinc ribbon domain-containing protein [Catellatospora aurea]|uniref:Zinc ribbon domain-containing protein n=1 Tax=Catellatospora aurea TaxID=1337874 RepID=A0ABW2H7E9_9ACTN
MQNISAKCLPVDGIKRTYPLAGLLRCAFCGRSMESQFSHNNVAYRCRHGHTSAQTTAMRQARNLYLREDVILGRIFAQLKTITSRDPRIVEEITKLQQNRNVPDLTRFLGTYGITVECRATCISLEPDQEKSITARALANGSRRGSGIPRQRTQQQKHKRGIVND